MPRQLLVISEQQYQEELSESLAQRWGKQPLESLPTLTPIPTRQRIRQAWQTATQVNFCTKLYPVVATEHRDAPALTVLGDFLRNGFLHRAIREQGGAYGGGAGYDRDNGTFRFFSYRDPRLEESLQDFDRALDWLQSQHHEPSSLEEAILNVMSRLDRPGSPAGEAVNAFFGDLHGRDAELRQTFRQNILEVQIADLQRVAMTYLQPQQANIAVIGSAKTLDGLTSDLQRLSL